MQLSADGQTLICMDINDIQNGVCIIPNSVTRIGEAAFEKCSNLTNIIIPESVTHIGERAFARCSGLTNISIPNSVTHIGDLAFFGCSGLTNISIPNAVTHIGEGAFARCSGLTNISIPNSVILIGVRAFAGCSGLTNISIPNSVTHIGEDIFWGCSGLTEVFIPESVTHIGASAFAECSGLTNISIPNAVTHIGEAAFFWCTNLTNIIIPESVTYIGASAFSGCQNLRVIMVEASNAHERQRIQNLLPLSAQNWVIPFDVYQEIKKAKSLEFISLRNEDIYLPLRRLPKESINLVFQFEGCLHHDINNVQLPIELDELPRYREDLQKAHIQCIQQQNTSFQPPIVIHKLQKVIDWIQQEISSKEQLPGFFSNPTNAALKIEREARIAVISKLIIWLSGDKNVTFSEEDIALLKVRSVMNQCNLEDLPLAPAHRILDEENLEDNGLYISRTMQVTAAGFFSGSAVMGGTLYLSSAAQAFVMNLLPFLSMTASMCTAVVACGIAMALLALVVHMAMNHTVELNAAIDLNVP